MKLTPNVKQWLTRLSARNMFKDKLHKSATYFNGFQQIGRLNLLSFIQTISYHAPKHTLRSKAITYLEHLQHVCLPTEG